MNSIIESFRQLCLEGSTEQEAVFFQEVQKATYWIPVAYGQEDRLQLQIRMIQSARGRTYIPAFLERESCGNNMKLMKMNYHRLRDLAEKQKETICGLVIDPYGEKIVIDQTLMQLMEKQRPAATAGERNAI